MNKSITITAITLVAMIMGIGTTTLVFAHDVTEANKNPVGICVPFFASYDITPGEHPDHNFNGKICNLNYEEDGRDHRWVMDDFILFNTKENVS